MGKIKENRRSKFPAILLAFMMVFTTMPFGIGGVLKRFGQQIML